MPDERGFMPEDDRGTIDGREMGGQSEEGTRCTPRPRKATQNWESGKFDSNKATCVQTCTDCFCFYD
jgi:hypothetical protein